MYRNRVWAVCLATMLAAAMAQAQVEPTELEESGTGSGAWVEPDPLDPAVCPWRDVQAWLAEQARFEIELGYTMVWQIADDVIDDSEALLSGSYDVAGLWTPIDDELWGVGQLGFLVEGGQIISHRDDEDLSANVGTAFGVNDDLDNTDIAVTELWWAHRLLEERLVVTLGKIDQSAFFDASRIANDETAQFLATPLVNNPSIAFPDNGLGVNATWTIVDGLYLSGGFGDAKAVADESGFNTIDGDELFYAGEVGFTTDALGGREGTFRLMGWTTRTDEDAEGSGLAISIDQELLADGLVVFGRYGAADEEVADFEAFFSAGVGFEGPLGKADDLVAVGYAWGRPAGADDSEQLIEAFYRLQVTETIAITPDVQWVVAPADGADDDTVFIGGLRMQATF